MRRKELDKHKAMATGVAQFLRDFIMSLDQILASFARFLDLVKTLDPSWFDSETDRAKSQVFSWALAMGLKATAPIVTSELKRHLKRLEEVRQAAVDVQCQLQTRDQRHQEMNHYMSKISNLLEERERLEKSGRTVPQELIQKIQRNQSKLSRSESELLRGNDVANKGLKKELENRGELLRACFDVTQIITCGFFVSTGAVICKAIHEAETEASEDAAARASRAPCSPALLDLPPDHPSREVLQPPEVFDPKDPLGGTLIPEPSGLGEEPDPLISEIRRDSAPNPDPLGGKEILVVGEELERLPVRRLKELLDSRGISSEGCVEKADLVKLLRESQGRQESTTPNSQASPQSAGYANPQVQPRPPPPPPPPAPQSRAGTTGDAADIAPGSVDFQYDSSDDELQQALLLSVLEASAKESAAPQFSEAKEEAREMRPSEVVHVKSEEAAESPGAGIAKSPERAMPPPSPPELKPLVSGAATTTSFGTAASPVSPDSTRSFGSAASVDYVGRADPAGSSSVSPGDQSTNGTFGNAETSNFSPTNPWSQPSAWPASQTTSSGTLGEFAWPVSDWPNSPGPPSSAEPSSSVQDADLLGLNEKK